MRLQVVERRRSLGAVATLLVTVVLSACGGSDSPTAPSVRIPSYAGVWSGTYTVTGCNQSGQVAAVGLCDSLGQTLPYGFNLTQSDRNVSGSFTLGSLQFPNTGGTVAQDESLPLSATYVADGVTIVVNWALNMPAQAITGTITQQWTSVGLTGSATLTGSINSAIRAASANAATASLGRHALTISELAAAMAGR